MAMDDVNVNAPPPRQMTPRRTIPPLPQKQPYWWAIVAFVVIVAIILGLKALKNNSGTASGRATPTPTVQTLQPTSTSVGGQNVVLVTATPPSALNTATATSNGQVVSTATAASSKNPTNPTALNVASRSCSSRQIRWTWSGASRAASYDVVVYDPRSCATIKTASTTATSYTLPAGPGATAALKVRSRNSAGTEPGYFTPGSVGTVPPITTNPTNITVSTGAGHKLTWSWTGARHATSYDLQLYHYKGGSAQTDINAHTNQGQWSTAVSPGVSYYLKVRSVGACAPSTYFTPASGAVAGATPTPGA
jgi:hypothetical protein